MIETIMKKSSIILIVIVLFALHSLYSEANKKAALDSEYCFPVGNDKIVKFSEFRERIIGYYADLRTSWIRGHKHSGIDIKGNFSEKVYSIGKGKVIDIFGDFPNRTVCLQHKNKENQHFYSMYVHIEDISVSHGEYVSRNTRLGRIFNQEELERSDFETLPHLHFEIRKNFNDHGAATYSCMNIQELNKFCIDPLKFFKINLSGSYP